MQQYYTMYTAVRRSLIDREKKKSGLQTKTEENTSTIKGKEWSC